MSTAQKDFFVVGLFMGALLMCALAWVWPKNNECEVSYHNTGTNETHVIVGVSR